MHGTTIATNTIIEGKEAKAGLITSEGFRDVLEIAYQTRPKLYDIFYDKPEAADPALSVRAACRSGSDPTAWCWYPLDEDAVRAVARELAAEGVEAIAVAFLHAYKDPTHERRGGEILAEECRDHADRAVLRHQPRIPRVSAHLDGGGQRRAAAARRPLHRAAGGAAGERGDPLGPASDDLVGRHHRRRASPSASPCISWNRDRPRA